MITHNIEKGGMLPSHKRVHFGLWRKILKFLKVLVVVTMAKECLVPIPYQKKERNPNQ